MFVVFVIISFIFGTTCGALFFSRKEKQKLIDATIPIADLIENFEEYARLVEGGELSTDAEAAIKLLKSHAEQKFLPAPAKAKKRRTFDGEDNNRKNDWCDMRCFEKEMAKATEDDERISIVRRWMNKYTFNTTWQTWCIEGLKSTDSRNYLRTMFDGQEQ